ncbi:hypothetical protein R1sor_019092 [Riccia sorocarpa]|uniref:VTT domain-containing protein n=1 Tax=Riccia sorocarpa TaxID=122646 RepID=A0ABD3IBJ5_9MARC
MGTLVRSEVIVGAEPSVVELQRSGQDADYVRLGNQENDLEMEMEEFELLVPEENRFWRTRRWWWFKLVGFSLVLVGGGAAFAIWLVPLLLDKVIIPMMVWEAREFSRPVLAIVLIISLAIFPIFIFPSGPSMWLTGMIFGYGYGFLIIMAGTFFGQTFPYIIGRWLLHDKIQDFLKRWPKKAAVLRIAEQGSWFSQFRVIAVLRVSPFPYPWFNYAMSGTNITYGPYIAGSMAGMVPEAFITIYSGRLLKSLADLKNRDRPLTWPEIIHYMVSFTIAVSTAVAVTIYGRRALQELELQEAAERDAADRQMPLDEFVVDHEELGGRMTKRSWSGELLSVSSSRQEVERSLSFDGRL